MGWHRRRRQGLQTQGSHDRIRHKERHRISVQDSRREKFLHDPLQDRGGDHQDFHRHQVIGNLRSREILHLLSRQDREAQLRPGGQVLSLRHQNKRRDRNKRIQVNFRNHLQPFFRLNDLQQTVNDHLQQTVNFIQRKPLKRIHQQRKLQVFFHHPILKLGQLLKAFLRRKLLIRKQLKKLWRLQRRFLRWRLQRRWQFFRRRQELRWRRQEIIFQLTEYQLFP